MNNLGAGFLGVFAYGVTSVLLFGGPLRALGLFTFWRDRLGVAYWPVIILVAILLAVFLTKFVAQHGMPQDFLPAVFVTISMGLSALLVGVYAEIQRGSVVRAFEPDVELRASIFRSFRNTPRDFQFFLHGAALKDCKPYAWSYQQMAFYELSPNVAANVLPTSWIEECDIKLPR